MKKVMLALLALSSVSVFASTCSDMQKAEESIFCKTYHGGNSVDKKAFCYFLSRAVSSP